jgi:hypothetical protein
MIGILVLWLIGFWQTHPSISNGRASSCVSFEINHLAQGVKLPPTIV